jgi:hypothetical protein
MDATPGATMTFIEIRPAPSPPRNTTKRWEVFALKDGVQLGIIQWLSGWRRYVFQPSYPTAFEETCMREIADFIERETQEQKGRQG